MMFASRDPRYPHMDGVAQPLPAWRKRLVGRLSVRDDVTELTYHRPPTRGELAFGHGATHYRTFTVNECCWPGTRIMKKWFMARDDGLRYYR